MFWDDLYEAFAHRDVHVIMGRKLRPFCPYYYLWLRMIESPLLVGGEATIADLDTAARICTADYGEAPAMLKAPLLAKLYYGWRLMRYDKRAVVAQWRSYLDDYTSPPDRLHQGTTVGTNRETFPYPIWMVSGLMMHCGMSKADAWMTPIGEAEWYLSGCDLHRDKDPNVVTGHDREFMHELRKERERIAQARKEAKLAA